MTLKFKKIPSNMGQVIKNPEYATIGSACFDLVANIDENFTIKSGKIEKIPCGIAIELEENFVALVFPRSGLSTNFGINLANSVGVVDSDYRGEIFVSLINNSDKDFILKPLERIAQLGIVPILAPKLVECNQLSTTARGGGGFGSTGR